MPKHRIKADHTEIADKWIPDYDMLEAIIERALTDLNITSRAERHWAVNAYKWFLHPTVKPWSYRWICDYLDIPLNKIAEHQQKARDAEERIRAIKDKEEELSRQRESRRIRVCELPKRAWLPG